MLVLLQMAVIFFLSSRPGEQVAEWNVWSLPAALAHFGLYALLGLLLFGAFCSRGDHVWQAAGKSIVVCIVYGISDEFHQMFVPGRTPTLIDVFWDGLGGSCAVAGAAFVNLWLRRGRQRVTMKGTGP